MGGNYFLYPSFSLIYQKKLAFRINFHQRNLENDVSSINQLKFNYQEKMTKQWMFQNRLYHQSYPKRYSPKKLMQMKIQHFHFAHVPQELNFKFPTANRKHKPPYILIKTKRGLRKLAETWKQHAQNRLPNQQCFVNLIVYRQPTNSRQKLQYWANIDFNKTINLKTWKCKSLSVKIEEYVILSDDHASSH